jgi:hypothetical protein
VINIIKKRVAFATLFILLLTNSLFSNGFTIDVDKGILLDKAISKMKEMGDELYQKTNISTILVVKNHLDKKEFLSIKERYLTKTKKPYILWIFSKTYADRENIGLNQMFNSKDLDGKFDKDSLFSPWNGTFTKILTVHKSKVDPTSAAFLNGYGDLVDMLAKSYGLKLDSSIGSGSHTSTNVLRFIFYFIVVLTIIVLLRNKFRK